LQQAAPSFEQHLAPSFEQHLAPSLEQHLAPSFEQQAPPVWLWVVAQLTKAKQATTANRLAINFMM
jgi:hypothetical protein